MTANLTGQDPPSAATQKIPTGSGMELVVEQRCSADRIELLLRATGRKNCILHWGIRNRAQSAWHILPKQLWPEGTQAAGTSSMQTPFKPHNGHSQIAIDLAPDTAPELLEFVLFFPEENRWDNNGHRNYQISIGASVPRALPGDFLKSRATSDEVCFQRVFDLEPNHQIAVAVEKSSDNYRVRFAANLPGALMLHWGVARRSPHEWLLPPESWRPAGTVLWGGHTMQTPFEPRDGFNQLDLVIPQSDAPAGIQFVLQSGTEGRWIKHQNGNFYIPVRSAARSQPGLNAGALTHLTDRIVQAEMNSGSWTLMHRFNLCFDLLGEAQGNPEALALLFVWLRYSGIRQLTWQRNYNTKPRELAHAQDRLGGRLAELYRADSQGRPFYRLMLATIGRGGDGQRIRDEILQIMHRHHLKEVSGHFLEEWHQKLHNNTTPDDVVICEAYLEFLRSGGNLDRFHETLQQGGVTRERLATFERPIRTEPDFVAHLKDPLIHDFENFLKILKAVHSSTDLETAINTARERLDSDTQALLWDIWNHRNDSAEGLVSLVERITEARRRVSHLLNQADQLRPFLYLDLALEQLVRVVVERNLHQHLASEQLIDLIGRVLENVALAHEDNELGACLRHWERLSKFSPEPRLSPGWALHAKSIVDRIGRALADWTDRVYRLLQPKAELLGQAFQAENWTITLFSEEVVRGSSLGFALSMLLHQVDRVLRPAANLGDWQIVSRGRGTGKVEVVETLRAVQGRQFNGAAVVIADKVNGDEELPEQVVAVLAPDVTDLVSHVAVRARNAQVLFASCSDSSVLDHLKELRGRFLHIEVTPGGDVAFKEVAQSESAAMPGSTRPRPALRPRPEFTRYAITVDAFNERVVGAKSGCQARLRGKLPNWVKQPASVALPFGCFEQVLNLPENQATAQQLSALASGLKDKIDADKLTAIRQAVERLTAPEELKSALREACVRMGIAWPADWEDVWRCIKQVWASKWNERAALSRRRMALSDDDLFMAVLIQPVVPADYAFVIHTVNPSNGNPDELYAEVVLGLGETLVGNFPGRALSFVWAKRTQQARLLSFPAKSVALYGSGLIFRSDSNGEDLAGYAGAGLYDSVLLNPPREKLLDYSDEPLIWDGDFRNGLLREIGKMGAAIEKSLGSPQDIEGAMATGDYYVVQSRPQVGLEPA
ncbi:MAG TPA: PEP/pyruvate-binding domain-containing protein [Verrucomicrobiae bacterium]|nr:PEP/pyruvate-binding domain-containing protein [Verrucomicrobiae bacterium]